MLNRQVFIKCVADSFKSRGFGDTRVRKIVERFNGLTDGYIHGGKTPDDAAITAMYQVMNEVAVETHERAHRAAKTLVVGARNGERVQQAVSAEITNGLWQMDGKPVSRGTAIARAAISMLEADPRFSGLAFSTLRDNYERQLFAILGDVLEKTGKGKFGVQRGKAHMPNIARELKGQNTGDAVAKEFAAAYEKVQDTFISLFNAAGGSIRKLKNFGLPQAQNGVKVGNDKAGWIAMHREVLDWDAMRWPDGSPIEAADRDSVLEMVHRTLATDGASKIDPAAFRGRGHSVGNALENHRFLVYKDGDAWLRAHEAYGDGSVFDVVSRHIQFMAHRIALVQQFGPNPELGMQNLKAHAIKAAGMTGTPKDEADAKAVLKNRFEPMMHMVLRDNAMDPHSRMGSAVIGAANILTAAQLGSASLLAIPGDFATTMAVRIAQNMPAHMTDIVATYTKAMAADTKYQRWIAAQSGFVFDFATTAVYGTQRFSGFSTYVPTVSSRIAEGVIRASLLSQHTAALRWANQAEFMGLLAQSRNTAFDDLPFAAVMRRYGITAKDWDTFRTAVQPWNPRRDVYFLRPIDILSSKSPDQMLFHKFQGMIWQESRNMVPDASIESTTYLKGTTRPDSLPGALLHSFSMYKSFPVSFVMTYGRLFASMAGTSRLKLAAGLGLGVLLSGALGTQMREISKGRDPLDMATASFWGKALLSGGGLSIWGDFLFSGVNEFGGGGLETFAGPVAGAAVDVANLVFGEPFSFIDAQEKGTDYRTRLGKRALDFAKQYLPGSGLWYARLALEREIWDTFEQWADPRGRRAQRNRMRARERDFGQGYYWPIGDALPERPPQF